METKGFAFAGDLLLRGIDCHSPKVIPQGYTLATLCDRVWILEDKTGVSMSLATVVDESLLC